MQTIFNFIFDNFLLVVVIVLGWYIFTQYKDLKEKSLVICVNEEVRKGRLYKCTDLGKEIIKKL